jgi:hypothetical protein
MKRTCAKRFFLIAISVSAISLCSQRGLGQITVPDLRAYTEWSAQNGDFRLRRPQIEYGRDYLWYCFRDAFAIDLANPDIDPILIPLNEQFKVAAIRRYRNTRRQRRFWEPVLRRVEMEIDDMLRLINSGQLDSETLRIHLPAGSITISDIYYRELHQLALDRGMLGAESTASAEYCSVDLLTEPKGGEIYYLPAGVLNLYEFMTQQRGKKNYPKPRWIAIVQPRQVPLTGKNFFRIDWSNGASKRYLVTIISDQPITFYRD